MKRLGAAALVVALAAPVGASDEPPPSSLFHDLVRDVRARIDAAIVARPPMLVPPKKVDIRWKLAKLGSLDLGAPLVTMTGADLDGDGKGELYAVTTREVIALGLRGKKLDELGRISFTGEPALPMPRDVIGSATVDPAAQAQPGPLHSGAGALVVSVSSFAKGMRVTWNGKLLAAAPADAGFLLCPGEVAQLVPGRNYFGDPVNGTYGARCRSGLVEPDGHPIRARAQLSLGSKLEVTVERCAAAGLGCQPAGKHEYPAAGAAFDVVDVDRDGRPELVYTGAAAPGDPDLIKVVTLGDDEKKHAKLRKSFTAGGVAGIAVSDLDGNGVAEVIAAVRIVGATRVDVWRIE